MKEARQAPAALHPGGEGMQCKIESVDERLYMIRALSLGQPLCWAPTGILSRALGTSYAQGSSPDLFMERRLGVKHELICFIGVHRHEVGMNRNKLAKASRTLSIP
jgi:hypothetical protein